jgi:nitrate reductase molybdenum cofactor assembly chaperone
MRPSAATFDVLARLLDYPSATLARDAGDAEALLARQMPEAAAELVPFVAFVASHDLGDCEEAYVRTFDVNPQRALEVGWQVFGEQYARGAFLVRMREMLRAAGVAESFELPDHMVHVLRLLPRIEASEARTLVESAVAPALRRILEDLAKQEDRTYAGVLRAVSKVVELVDRGVCTSAQPGGVR